MDEVPEPQALSEPARPLPRPCASCPYRRDAPQGLWHEEEYARLPKYDGDIADQVVAGAFNAFFCHQRNGAVCSGWLGHREHPSDLLAVRLGVSGDRPQLHPVACVDYTTDVPLWGSGREVYDHSAGHMTEEAWQAAQKLQRAREARR